MMDVHEICFFTAGNSPSLTYATGFLKENFRFSDTPGNTVTHLLLPVPSFAPDGTLKGGGSLSEVLKVLPKNITVVGGRLNQPELAGYTTIDLLQDPVYLAQNAKITAYCAVKYAEETLPVILEHCPALVVGWGRIGKCLARLLRQMGAEVTVYARKAADRAACASLGYHVTEAPKPYRYRVIFNTAPAMIIPDCPDEIVKIDLASTPGLGGKNVIWARFLPGKDAPESSGRLIADRLSHIIRKD